MQVGRGGKQSSGQPYVILIRLIHLRRNTASIMRATSSRDVGRLKTNLDGRHESARSVRIICFLVCESLPATNEHRSPTDVLSIPVRVSPPRHAVHRSLSSHPVSAIVQLCISRTTLVRMHMGMHIHTLPRSYISTRSVSRTWRPTLSFSLRYSSTSRDVIRGHCARASLSQTTSGATAGVIFCPSVFIWL